MTSQGDGFLKAATFVTRASAAWFGWLAAWMAWRAMHGEKVLPLLLSMCLGLLAWGTWRLRPKALDVAPGPLLFTALMFVVGAFTPFVVIEFLGHLAMSCLAVFAAACTDHVRAKTAAQPPSRVVLHLLMVVMLAACLVLTLALRLWW